MNPVSITHPDVEGTATVSERAFLRVHQGNGWRVADTQPPAPPAAPGEPEPVKRPQRNDSTDAWRAYAVSRGMPQEQADAMTRDGDDGLIATFDTLDDTQES